MNENNEEDEISSQHYVDNVEIARKRSRLDPTLQKCWSLADKQTDREVLQEMGVGILEMDDTGDSNTKTSRIKLEPKRKRNIENVNPNVSLSPKSKSTRTSPIAGPSRIRSPKSAEKSPCKILQSSENYNTSVGQSMITEHLEEETPLPLHPVNTKYMRISKDYPNQYSNEKTGEIRISKENEENRVPTSSPAEVRIPTTGPKKEEVLIIRRRQHLPQKCGPDAFAVLSDEVMLSIFKWLPKKTLADCMLVSKRWHQIASDETFWQRLELGNRVLTVNAIGRILARKPIIVRLAGSEIGDWANPSGFNEPSRIQYLDLSMCTISISTLNAFLERCPALRKLSLETGCINENTCRLIGRCNNMETLNLTMTSGITADGLLSILQGCNGLQSLNISWSNLSAEALNVLVDNAPQRIQRLNIAGARKISDDMIEILTARCFRLLELDLSDCLRLTAVAVTAVSKLTRLEHLALSRCYHLTPHALKKLGSMQSLQYLEIWGMLPETALAALRAVLGSKQVNQFMHSAIARPTVGNRRTSIWGLRTRD